MEISEIDELDHRERLLELQLQLDAHHSSGEDSLGLVELEAPSGRWESTIALEKPGEDHDPIVQATRQLHISESRRAAMEVGPVGGLLRLTPCSSV